MLGSAFNHIQIENQIDIYKLSDVHCSEHICPYIIYHHGNAPNVNWIKSSIEEKLLKNVRAN